MKEMQRLLRIMSDGLKTLAHGVEALAGKVDEIAKNQVPVETQKKKTAPTAARGKVVKKPVQKNLKVKDTKPATATDAVLELIGESKKGVSSAKIAETTGYSQKKVSNIVYRLRKQGKIKNVQKGVYVRS